jgi:hypothetical protein
MRMLNKWSSSLQKPPQVIVATRSDEYKIYPMESLVILYSSIIRSDKWGYTLRQMVLNRVVQQREGFRAILERSGKINPSS